MQVNEAGKDDPIDIDNGRSSGMRELLVLQTRVISVDQR